LIDPQNITKLLQNQKIANIEQLKAALGTKVDMTVFRKLKDLGYLSCYSHRGSFYTLECIPTFDDNGLWSHEGVHFSKHGTLRNTARVLVEQAEAGLLAREVEGALQVTTKDVLRDLEREGKIRRTKVDHRYVYGSADKNRFQQQLRARRIHQSEQKQIGLKAVETLSCDELKAALILFVSLLDEQQRRLYAGLESLKWGHGGDRKVADLLGIAPQTVAAGRNQLLRNEVQVGRARKSGAGRKSVEKKLHKSSSESTRS
jgi:hypothetical protein